jgi:2-oxoisovalerate dehydrogenase E1 component beta subunit
MLLEWGTPVYDCETVLSLLADLRASLAPLMPESACRAGIELVDLPTVLPWDVETINYLRVSDLVLLLKSCMNISR